MFARGTILALAREFAHVRGTALTHPGCFFRRGMMPAAGTPYLPHEVISNANGKICAFALRGFRSLATSSSASATATAGTLMGAAVGEATQRGFSSSWSIKRKLSYYTIVYKQLSKFRLSALVVSTAAAGYVLGSGESIEWAGLGWTCLGTMASSACANTLNQLKEIKLDARMKRTMNRPLPSGRITPASAAVFAASMGVVGVSILYTQTNSLTAMLGAANIALYAGVYTSLKQVTVANTWVGAVVGAVPPLMGWAAARGELDAGAAVLAGALYFWQLPHFLALAWMCKEDYAAGGHRMLSLVDSTGRRTAAAALRNCVYLAPIGFLAVAAGVTTQWFAYEAMAVTTYMGYYATQFYTAPSLASSKALFRSSLLHLPALMALMIFHRVPQVEGAIYSLDDVVPVVMVPSEMGLQMYRKLWSIFHWPMDQLVAIGVLERPKSSEHSLVSPSKHYTKSSLVVNLPHIDIVPFPWLSLPEFPSMSCPSRVMCDNDETSRS